MQIQGFESVILFHLLCDRIKYLCECANEGPRFIYQSQSTAANECLQGLNVRQKYKYYNPELIPK